MTLSFSSKLALLSVPPVLGGAALLFGRVTAMELPSQLAQPVETAHYWILGLTVLYLISAFVAWRFAGHFGISGGRMLLWALIAFLCLNNGIELLAEHRTTIWVLFGDPGPNDLAILTSVRARLAAWAALFVLSATAVAIGFEPTGGLDETQ